MNFISFGSIMERGRILDAHRQSITEIRGLGPEISKKHIER